MEYVKERRFLKIASCLANYQEEDGLMRAVLKEIIAASNCQKGVLFLWKENRLYSKATLQSDGTPWLFEPWIDEMSVLAATEKKVQSKSISNKNSDCFDIAIKNEDLESAIQTISILTVPMLDFNNDVIGVIRLNNARNEQGQCIPFSPPMQEMVLAVAGLTAVSLSNRRYIEDIRSLFASFVRVVSATIDERTPFNANHTRNMAKYGWRLVSYLNEQHELGNCEIYFDHAHRQQFIMSIWLHDMGKMVIPDWIMNKNSRLGRREQEICKRLERIKLLNEIRYLKKEISEEEYLAEDRSLTDTSAFISMLNNANTLLTHDIVTLNEISKKIYLEKDGSSYHWISNEELQCLSIEKGTLTDEERQIMEGHVVFTEKLLQEIVFSKEYSMVPIWASAHHEYLDGSGYPKHLKGEQIPPEVRLLTILDIFDALIAADRPYKTPMALPVALDVLNDMAKSGKLDRQLVDLFIKSKCWESGFLPL